MAVQTSNLGPNGAYVGAPTVTCPTLLDPPVVEISTIVE